MTIIHAKPLRQFGISGPTSALNNEAPLFDGTTGKKIKAGSGFIITANLMQAADKALLLSGTTDGTPASGAGTRMMWIPAKKAFRAGEVTGTEWDDINIGEGSVAFGKNGIASASYATHFGYKGAANGLLATHFGCRGAASSTYSTHFGYEGIANGAYAIHFGSTGTASGTCSTHFGYKGIANGYYATHFGSNGTASGACSIHFGQYGKAEGDYSIVGGSNMQLSAAADKSFAFGHHASAVALTQPNTFYIFPGGTAGKVALGVTVPTAMLDVGSDIIRLRNSKTPSSSGAAGNQGDECWDANYHYRCTATNNWKRIALNAF